MQLDPESSRCPATSRSLGIRRSLEIQLCPGGASGGQPTWLPPLLSSFPTLLTSSPDRSCMWTGGRLLALASGGIKEIRHSNLLRRQRTVLDGQRWTAVPPCQSPRHHPRRQKATHPRPISP